MSAHIAPIQDFGHDLGSRHIQEHMTYRQTRDLVAKRRNSDKRRRYAHAEPKSQTRAPKRRRVPSTSPPYPGDSSSSTPVKSSALPARRHSGKDRPPADPSAPTAPASSDRSAASLRQARGAVSRHDGKMRSGQHDSADANGTFPDNQPQLAQTQRAYGVRAPAVDCTYRVQVGSFSFNVSPNGIKYVKDLQVAATELAISHHTLQFFFTRRGERLRNPVVEPTAFPPAPPMQEDAPVVMRELRLDSLAGPCLDPEDPINDVVYPGETVHACVLGLDSH